MSEETPISLLPPGARAALREVGSALELSEDRKAILGTRLRNALLDPRAGAEQVCSLEGALPIPAASPLRFSVWKMVGVSTLSLVIGWWGGASFSGKESTPVTFPESSTDQEIGSSVNEPEVAPSPAEQKKAQKVVQDAVTTQEEPVNSPAPNQVQQKPTKAPLSFYEELSYLRRAQSALREGNPALGLGLMLSLDEVKKEGALLSERRMTKVLALCALGRVDEARVIGGEVLKGDSAQIYGRRLESSCVGSTK